MIMEKYLSASSLLPSPNVLATKALPPVPSIKPMAPMIIAIGKAIFTAESAISPTRLDTNSPSTTLYNDAITIVTIEGSVNLNSLP